MKKLEDMSREELFKLFPIKLTPHQTVWKTWYEEEKAQIERALAGMYSAVHHIGSTAIEGIWAKPTVDILVEIAPEADMERAAEALCRNGWRVMNRQKARISLNKGYGDKGLEERVFHLHLRRLGDCDEICFRDLLQKRPELAKEYESLKLSLWKQYEHDRDGYTEAKTAFVTRFTQLAKLSRERQK